MSVKKKVGNFLPVREFFGARCASHRRGVAPYGDLLRKLRLSLPISPSFRVLATFRQRLWGLGRDGVRTVDWRKLAFCGDRSALCPKIGHEAKGVN